MNQDLIDKLNKGIHLEQSKQFLPWNTPFKKLKDLGNPNHQKMSDQREDLIWTNETILLGLPVGLTVMRWFGLSGMNRKLKHAYAYISHEDFVKTKERLDLELGQVGKFRKSNSLEHRYTWKLDKCRIKLIQGDRFGPHWTVDIKHKSSWYGWLQK